MSRVVFRQLLAGRDFARADPVAAQMVNFAYLIGDREAGEALLVDPAWSVGELVDLAEAEGLTVTGVLATHNHPDHVGGPLFGRRVEGVAELLADPRVRAKVHVQAEEARWLRRVTGLSRTDVVEHRSGDIVHAGGVPVTLLHTPGHTPGSQCFLVERRLVSGDTLFLDGCGRTDLPGGDPDALYKSLTQRLAQLPDDTVLYPDHRYSPEPSAGLGEVRRRNVVFRVPSLEAWRALFA